MKKFFTWVIVGLAMATLFSCRDNSGFNERLTEQENKLNSLTDRVTDL